MPLRLIIENTPIDEIASMPSRPANDFIEAALYTARYSRADTRSLILADVCEVLNCPEDELSFLFERKSVPTKTRRIFELELPDYRMSQSEIYKFAAE